MTNPRKQVLMIRFSKIATPVLVLAAVGRRVIKNVDDLVFKLKTGSYKSASIAAKNDYCGACFGATLAATSAGYCGGRNRRPQ